MVTEEELGFEAGIAVCLGFWFGVSVVECFETVRGVSERRLGVI
jgi:hypothetical protein